MACTIAPAVLRVIRPRLVTQLRAQQSQFARFASSSAPLPPRRRRGGRTIGLLTVAVASGAVVWAYPLVLGTNGKVAAAGPQQAEIEFEPARRRARSKEDNRDLLSSQHVQVQASWENPGVYAWGSNGGRVVAPDAPADAVVKTPRRIAFFDGRLLRDLRMDRDAGAAVLENGDLVQWGSGFAKDATAPAVTLKGKDLVKVALSRDRVIGLSASGAVYSLPISRADQAGTGGTGSPASATSWLPFWSSPAARVSYRTLSPPSLSWGERVVDIKSGQEHCLLLTSSGRVFSLASSTDDFPSKGQLGIPGLTWMTKPQGAYDQPHEISALRGFKTAQIATGDFHSVVLDSEGRLFAFGDNSAGQLGFAPEVGTSFFDSPALLPLNKLYSGTGLSPRVTSIAAGGSTTFFTVDATRTGPAQDKDNSSADNSNEAPTRSLGNGVVADTWACGAGLYGSLGTGKWTHISSDPTKIKALSGLYEWDEESHKVIPIRLARIAAGANHASAVMANVTYVAASRATGANDTNWGADIVFWGGNEFYQLGNGKRSNANAPLYIAPLDGGQADAALGRTDEAHRFQITPRKTVRLGADGKGRRVSVEQRVECGRYVTAVYSAT